MISFLLRQQKGYIKFPCFLCMWDSRNRENHWTQKEWQKHDTLKAGMPNVIHEPIVSRDKIIFPLLHIKLGMMKQFVRALHLTANVSSIFYIHFLDYPMRKSKQEYLIHHRSVQLCVIKLLSKQ